MKKFSTFKKYGVRVLAPVAAGASSLYASTVSADWLTDAQTALTAAGTDGKTIGGYVIVVVAGMAVIGLAIAVMRKLG